MKQSDEPDKLEPPLLAKPHSTIRRVRELTGKGEWSEVNKIRAVAMYLEIGVMTRVSDLTGIPIDTLNQWKKSPWWFEVKQKIMSEQDDQVSTRFLKIVHKAQKEVEDRVENGEWIVLRDGSKARIPMKAKDAQYIVNSSIEKRNLLNDRPTSRTETLTMKDKLAQIGEEFKKYAKAREINAIPTAVDETTSKPE